MTPGLCACILDAEDWGAVTWPRARAALEASPESSYVTGAELHVDGGYSA